MMGLRRGRAAEGGGEEAPKEEKEEEVEEERRPLPLLLLALSSGSSSSSRMAQLRSGAGVGGKAREGKGGTCATGGRCVRAKHCLSMFGPRTRDTTARLCQASTAVPSDASAKGLRTGTLTHRCNLHGPPYGLRVRLVGGPALVGDDDCGGGAVEHNRGRSPIYGIFSAIVQYQGGYC